MVIERTDETRKLRACPFCGDTELRIYRYLDDADGSEVGCKITCMGCLISFYQEEANSVEDNVDAWNRRARDGKK